MKVLDLFSGIGGFSLGLERAGMKTVAFCEIDPYCRRVLAKHWPGVPIYGDVRTLTAARLAADGIIDCVADTEADDVAWRGHFGANTQYAKRSAEISAWRGVDVICGGFPCQDISVAGNGAGIDGSRSGLWSEFARIIGEVRPRYVIVENVAALLGRGLARVLGDLAALGFDAEWHCIPASAVGAPHRRDRVWIVAYPKSDLRGTSGNEIDDAPNRASEEAADAASNRLAPERQRPTPGYFNRSDQLQRGSSPHWLTEPDVGRVANGVPARMDRLRSLGNAVVPQIPELIGRAIMDAAA